MTKKIEVKYGGVLVGYTDSSHHTVQFLDNDAAKEVQDLLKQNSTVYVSSRAAGKIDKDNKAIIGDTYEFDILKHPNK